MDYIITIPLYNEEEKEAVLDCLFDLAGEGRTVTIKEVKGSMVKNEYQVFI